MEAVHEDYAPGKRVALRLPHCSRRTTLVRDISVGLRSWQRGHLHESMGGCRTHGGIWRRRAHHCRERHHFPSSGTYTLEIKYAALDARPVELQMDNKTVAKVCRLATGGWETSKAAYEKSAQLYIPAGTRTFRLQRADAFPHIVS